MVQIKVELTDELFTYLEKTSFMMTIEQRIRGIIEEHMEKEIKQAPQA